MTARYEWEGNYTLGQHGEVLLAVKVETGDPSVGQEGISVVEAHAFDAEGREIPLSDADFETVCADGALLEKIDDTWRDETAARMEARR